MAPSTNNAASAAVSGEVRWRADITSLVFSVQGHGAICAVHRGVFRTLLGASPSADDCLNYFRRFEDVFRQAADAKIALKGIPAGTSLHLTSRDIARKLLKDAQTRRGEQQ